MFLFISGGAGTGKSYLIKITMKHLLSDGRIKMELTEYISAKVIQRSEYMGKCCCGLGKQL